MATSTSQVNLAILDDYSSIAVKHFSHIQNLKVDDFPVTLDPTTTNGFEELVQRLQDYEIISTMRERTPISSALMARLPKLKLIMTTALRNASINVAAAKTKGILVTGTKGNAPSGKDLEAFGDDLPPPPEGNSVNQHAWALLLSLASRIARDDAALKSSPESWQSGLMIPLGGKVLGCVGLGKLGLLMAKTAILGFGMKVVAWSENLTQDKADASAETAGLPKGSVKVVGKEELFRQADVVSLHLVLSDRSRGTIGAKELELMKRSALLINTSRGGLIDEEALLQALREGRIRGAALDVYWREPLPNDSPWRSKDFKSEVVLSPHMGYANAGTMQRWYQEQAGIVETYLQGKEVPNQMS